MPEFQYFYRQVYGVNVAYPANDTARLVARIAGHKTFPSTKLQLIFKLCQELGVPTQVVADPAAPRGWGVADTSVAP